MTGMRERHCLALACKGMMQLQADDKLWLCNVCNSSYEESGAESHKREIEDSVAQCQTLLARVKRILERMD